MDLINEEFLFDLYLFEKHFHYTDQIDIWIFLKDLFEMEYLNEQEDFQIDHLDQRIHDKCHSIQDIQIFHPMFHLLNFLNKI